MTDRDPKQFMDAVRGVPTHHVIKALNLLTPGIDWQKCSKGYMAEEWAKKRSYQRMDHVDPVKLAAMARARMNGDKDWRSA